VLVSVAVSIALFAHLAPVLGAAPSGPTVRRALELAGAPAMLDRIARARAHAWTLIAGTAAGFPWPVIAGKELTGWVVIDMDATLVTAYSDKEGAAPTWKKGYGLPLGAWCRNTRECLGMKLRPGQRRLERAGQQPRQHCRRVGVFLRGDPPRSGVARCEAA
jgi:hypothetical protein